MGERSRELMFSRMTAGLFGIPLWKSFILGFFGLIAGGIIAAGVFAFLVIIGIFPRIMGKTKTKRIMLYETIIIAGGVLGNISDIYEIYIP